MLIFSSSSSSSIFRFIFHTSYKHSILNFFPFLLSDRVVHPTNWPCITLRKFETLSKLWAFAGDFCSLLLHWWNFFCLIMFVCLPLPFIVCFVFVTNLFLSLSLSLTPFESDPNLWFFAQHCYHFYYHFYILCVCGLCVSCTCPGRMLVLFVQCTFFCLWLYTHCLFVFHSPFFCSFSSSLT